MAEYKPEENPRLRAGSLAAVAVVAFSLAVGFAAFLVFTRGGRILRA